MYLKPCSYFKCLKLFVDAGLCSFGISFLVPGFTRLENKVDSLVYYAENFGYYWFVDNGRLVFIKSDGIEFNSPDFSYDVVFWSN